MSAQVRRHLFVPYLPPTVTLITSAAVLPHSEPEEIVAAYERDYARLATLAAELGLAREDAEELIQSILNASLTRRVFSDTDAWLEASLRSAARSLKERS